MVLGGIEKENIDNIESFISSNLLPVLKDAAERNGQKLDMKEMLLFFGNQFASKPDMFRFTQGEKILINQIKQHVQKKGFKYFALKKRKLNMPKLIETAVGSIFGESETSEDANDEVIQAKSMSTEKSVSLGEDCDKKLLQSANKIINKELLATGSTANLIMTADMIDIDRSDSEHIKGYVSCAFCKEKKKVSYKHSNDNWIMSNLIIHLKKCSYRNKLNEKKTSDKDAQQSVKEEISKSEDILPLVEPKQQDDEPSKKDVESVITPVTVKEDAEVTNIDLSKKCVFLKNNLIKQMSIQNIKMRNTVINNNGTIVERQFRANIQNIRTDLSLGVCEISPDGNCVFGAIVHQLHRLEIGSEQHKTKMQQLRMDVVKHIENNITDYLFIMKDLIYHKNSGKKITNLVKEIQHYLKKLSNDRFWAGNESLHAISIMYKKNIVIINENDKPNMILKFNPDFKESIIIFLNASRNHYESVVNADTQVISAMAADIIENETKSNFIEGVIEIQDD